MTAVSPSLARTPYPALGLLVPLAILVGTVSFNPLLAMVNAHVRPLGAAPVAAAELALVAAAHAFALSRFRPEMRVWYALMAILVAFALYRGLGVEGFSVRYLRDVLIIPTFVLLGLAVSRQIAIRCYLAVHAVVCAVALFEVLSLDLYSSLFSVQSYYVNTRGVDIEQFTAEGSDLYVSAVRPEARFFAFVDLHRVSSVFLEPVSLGNYAILSTVFLTAWRQDLRPALFVALAISTFLLMIASDGRLAFISAVIILAAAMMVRLLPRNSAVLYAPLTILAMFMATSWFGLRSGVDDFPGRIAYSVELLHQFRLADLLGLSDRLAASAVDTGFAYMIISQSIMGATVLWLFVVLGMPEHTLAQRRMKHGICLYLVLTMTVSFSFLTIKTAGLLWFAYGATVRTAEPMRS
jgi:putative polymerase